MLFITFIRADLIHRFFHQVISIALGFSTSIGFAFKAMYTAACYQRPTPRL